MFSLVVFGALFAATNAMVCMPQLCDMIKQEPLNCAGSVIKNGGLCGCTDACAKIDGETCQATFRHGIIPAGTCDTGLVCQEQEMMAFGQGLCVKQKTRQTRTKCEQERMASLMSMDWYESKWMPSCDKDGNFLPMQCDITGHCFCVDPNGTMQGEKLRGTVTCPAVN